MFWDRSSHRSQRLRCGEEGAREHVGLSMTGQGKGRRRDLTRALCVPPALFQTRGFVLELSDMIAPRRRFGDDKAKRYLPSPGPRLSDSLTKDSAEMTNRRHVPIPLSLLAFDSCLWQSYCSIVAWLTSVIKIFEAKRPRASLDVSPPLLEPSTLPEELKGIRTR